MIHNPMLHRVAYLSNMNNNGFSAVQYLRDRGIDAHVFRFPYEHAHFSPEADSFRQDIHEFSHSARWGNVYDIGKFTADDLAEQLAPYTVLFGAGTAPAYVTRAGRRLDAFIPYGDDIQTLPYRRLARPRQLLARQQLRALQRRGIKNTRHILMDDAAPEFVSCLNKLSPGGIWHRNTPPALYLPAYSRENLTRHRSQSRLYSAIRAAREAHDLLLFSHTRHHWISRPGVEDWIMKGSDKLIRGLALFARRNPAVNVHLATFEYGPDVAASKQLIRDLGIEPLVSWHPLSQRKEIMMGLAEADIGIGALHESWFSYGVMMEILASGIPFIGRREGALANVAGSYPMVSAGSAEALAEAFEAYVENPAAWKKMGLEAQQWLARQIDTSVSLLAEIARTTSPSPAPNLQRGRTGL